MLYCPKCLDEFRDGFSVCPDCEVSLVKKPNNLPTEKKPEQMNKEEMRELFIKNEPTLFALAKDDFECGVIRNMLKENGIPSMKKYAGADLHIELFMGVNNESIQIYVPKSALEKARVLVKENLSEEFLVEIDATDTATEEKYNKKRSRKAWIILACLIGVPVLGVLIYQLILNLIK